MRIVTHSNSGEQGARRVPRRWASAFLALTLALAFPFLGQALAQGNGQPPNGMGFVHRGVAVWRDTRTGALRVLNGSSRRRRAERATRCGPDTTPST